jgi:soluble lytic murein transglycosylase
VAPAAAPPAAVDPVAPSAASPASSPVPTPDAAGLAAPGVTAGSESVAGQGDAAVPAAAPPVAAPAPALPRRAAQAPPVRAHMPASAQSAPTVPVAGPADTGIVAAHAAWVDGDADRVGAYAPQVAGSLLEPYVAYWQASARLRGPNPDDSAVRPFLARYPGTVLADRLRADWLMALATRGDFATFDAERRRLVLGGDDAQLACYTLLARYLVDDGHRREAISREARRTLSLTSDPGGDGCTALAERLLDDGLLSIWPRLQALVERNQFPAATAAAQRLPPADAAAVKALVQNPAAWLAAARLDQMPHALPLLAIVALARDAPDRAAVYADRLDPTLTPEERAVAWGRIGRSAQHSLAPQAHAWFERGGELVGLGLDYVRGPDVLETRVRAALRRGAGATVAETYAVSGVTARALPAPSISTPIEADQGAAGPTGPDWAAVRRGIAHMSAEQQADSTWIYWNAQAAIALGQVEEGRAALQSIADRFSFYGRLAAEQLGLPMRLPARPETAPDAVIEQLALRPGFQRARKLYELGLRDEGNREWNWELRGMDDVYLHASAELARRLGVLDRMIASSERTRAVVDIDQRYPMPYRDFMTATAAPLGVDAAWIYGLIRQESRFMEDIRSNAGAVGLMQLMPATARFVARRIGFDHYRAERIGEVNVNLRLGTEYLKLVSDDQDGQPMLASAAYNAGPNRVRKWRAALARPLDGAIFAETIPISETRDYVKKVLFNTVVYGAMLDRPAVSLRALLPPVSPKGIPATDLP